jgi:hypothetical protein
MCSAEGCQYSNNANNDIINCSTTTTIGSATARTTTTTTTTSFNNSNNNRQYQQHQFFRRSVANGGSTGSDRYRQCGLDTTAHNGGLLSTEAITPTPARHSTVPDHDGSRISMPNMCAGLYRHYAAAPTDTRVTARVCAVDVRSAQHGQ